MTVVSDLSTAKYGLGVVASVALLVACNAGVQPALGTSSVAWSGDQLGSKALPPSLALRLTNPAGFAPPTFFHPGRRKSWLAPEAKGQALLYTSATADGVVEVYLLKKETFVGELGSSVLRYPEGECAGQRGSVWIADYEESIVVEYARDAASPTKILNDPKPYTWGCSVDPATGDVAVANFYSGGSGGGSVVIFTKGSGSGTIYELSSYYVWAPAYDNKGNLFVEVDSYSAGPGLLELPKGGKSFMTISLPVKIGFPAGANWDGKYVVVNDQNYDGLDEQAADLLSISGSQATLKRQVVYTDTCNSTYAQVTQPAIYKGQYIGGNIYCYPESEFRIDIWSYATGGNPLSYINGDKYIDDSFGQTVSE